MSRQNPYTQRQLERMIKAAQRCGARAIVKPDGSVVFEEIEAGPQAGGLTTERKPRDAREKLGVH